MLPPEIRIDSADREPFELMAIVEGPAAAFDRNDLHWTSSDPAIADFSDGILTGYQNGTVTLTCTLIPYGISAESSVTVQFPEPDPVPEETKEEPAQETEKEEEQVPEKESVYSFYGFDETVSVGSQGKITAYINNQPVTGSEEIRYECAQPNILQVESDGSYKALAPGVAYVYLTDWEGNFDCSIITVAP